MSLRTIGLCTATAFVMSGLALGQMDHSNMGHTTAAPTATGPAAEVQRSYAALKVNILKAADAMPADGIAGPTLFKALA